MRSFAKKGGLVLVPPPGEVDRFRCNYEIDRIRCSARGTICEAISGPEKVREDQRRWLCRDHYRLRNDALGSREALYDLIDNPPPPSVDWREKMLMENGLGELQTAWRDMDEEQKRDLISQTIRKSRNFARKSVVREQPSAGSVSHVGVERDRQLDALYRAMTPEDRWSSTRR